MEIIKDEVVHDGTYVRVIKRWFKNKNGSEGLWELVERKMFGEIVAVAAITKNKEIVLEKSFRIPTQRTIIELPAGLMDEKNETAEDAARRELLEETGYSVGELEYIFETPVDQGLNKHKILFFLGLNARLTDKQRTDDAEHIEVIKVPTKNLFGYLKKARQEHDVDIKILGLLPFLEERNLL